MLRVHVHGYICIVYFALITKLRAWRPKGDICAARDISSERPNWTTCHGRISIYPSPSQPKATSLVEN